MSVSSYSLRRIIRQSKKRGRASAWPFCFRAFAQKQNRLTGSPRASRSPPPTGKARRAPHWRGRAKAESFTRQSARFALPAHYGQSPQGSPLARSRKSRIVYQAVRALRAPRPLRAKPAGLPIGAVAQKQNRLTGSPRASRSPPTTGKARRAPHWRGRAKAESFNRKSARFALPAHYGQSPQGSPLARSRKSRIV